MRCADCLDTLNAYVDGELLLPEQQDVRDHLGSCPECAAELRLLVDTTRTLKEGLVRHSAPDVLKARIRTSLAAESAAAAAAATEIPRRVARPSSWPRLAAAGVAIAILSSAITLASTRRPDASSPVERELLASHIRSLQPGHLTDVASTDQHNVKPWFNGRVDLSPAVPSLDSAGFPIVGGRLDYIDGRTAAAVVYSRRQHLINVYSWPTSGADERPHASSDHGYHLVQWKRGGIEQWAVSDLNTAELDQFVAAFIGANPTTPSR